MRLPILLVVAMTMFYSSEAWSDAVAAGKNHHAVFSDGQLIVAAAIATDPPYLADKSGKTDASAAIQKLVDDVQGLGGGTAFLPAGRYRQDHRITVPSTVTLCGEWRMPKPGQPLWGTVLLAYADKGKSEGPALLSSAELGHANVYNMAVYYPDQNPEHPVPYPFTLQGNVSYFHNITLVNSYQGVLMSSFSGSSLSSVYGTALKRGFVLKSSGELGSSYNLRLSSDYWTRLPEAHISRTAAASVRRYVADNLTAIQIGKVDGLSFYNAELSESKTPVVVKMEDDEVKVMVTDRSQYGFGGGMAKVKGRRTDVEGGWYFGSHYFDLDNYPQLSGKGYSFARWRHAAKMGLANVYQATDFGVIADEKSDDSAALQKALDTAAANGGGTVLLPHGMTVIRSTITIPSGVELRGGYLGAPVRAWYLKVSTLVIDFDAQSKDPDNAPAAINLKANSGLRGIAVCHATNIYETDADGKMVVSTYPYAIRGLGKQVYVYDCIIPNAYNGIDLGQVRCDQAQVVNVWATPYHYGIRVGAGSDSVKLENINMDLGPHCSDYRLITGPIVASGVNVNAGIQGYLDDHSIQYLLADCTNLTTFQLAGFAPHRYMEFVDQGYGGCRDAAFWSCIFDVPKVEAIRFRGGGKIDFYGYFVTGGGDKVSRWMEFDDSFNGRVSVYGLSQQLTFNNGPFTVSDDKLNIYSEQSLTTRRPVTASSHADGYAPMMALDGNTRTLWQSDNGDAPHTLTVQLAAPSMITRWRTHNAGTYLPRQFNTASAELWASAEGRDYFKLGQFEDNTQDWVDIPVKCATAVRFVQLRVLQCQAHESTGNIARIAAFDVFGFAAGR